MFGKLKNLFNKAEEAVENIVESASTHEQTPTEVASNTASNTNSNESSIEDYATYCAQIPEIDDNYHVYYHKFFEAIQTGDRSKIESSIETWKSELDKMTIAVKNMGTFKGDDSLIIAGTDYFQKKKNNIADEFTKFAEAVITNSDDVYTLKDKAEEVKVNLVEEINDKLERFRRKNENAASDQAYTDFMNQQDIAVEAAAKDNPLLEPIHGVSLFDYAAGMVKIGSGTSEAEVLGILGVEKPQWDEAGLMWNQRMEEDSEMTVMTVYGQYFAKVDEHPKLGTNGNLDVTPSDNPNVERMKTDEKYFYDLMAERQAAFEVGKDGGQYIVDKYGINLIDFQAQALIWARSGNLHQMIDYQEEQYQKYLAQFQKEMGGTIADDIEF